MKEDFLHYIWQYKQFAFDGLRTTEDQAIKIIKFGTINRNAGPDFSYAEIEINNIRYVGHIEMHVNSSQWNQHKHQQDPQYNNVILHVVWNHDRDVLTKSGYKLPTLSLNGRVKRHLFDNYQQLMQNRLWIPCANQIQSVAKDRIDLWTYSVVAQRLDMKSKQIETLLDRTKNDYEKTLFILISRALGPNVNQESMQEMAERTNLNQLLKTRDQLSMIEAYLFGISGLIPEDSHDPYVLKLKEDFGFLQNKYDLVSMKSTKWKFSRMRPHGYPTLLIALLADIVQKMFPLFAKLTKTPIQTVMSDLKAVQASTYWDRHYTFGEPSSTDRKKKMSDMRIQLLAINAFIPLMYTYAKSRGDHDMIENIIDELKTIASEKNSIISKWKELGMHIQDAKSSQAFLHLKKHYCSHFRCTECMIGHQILNIETKPSR